MVLGVSYSRVLAQRPTGCCSASYIIIFDFFCLFFHRFFLYLQVSFGYLGEIGFSQKKLNPVRRINIDSVYLVATFSVVCFQVAFNLHVLCAVLVVELITITLTELNLTVRQKYIGKGDRNISTFSIFRHTSLPYFLDMYSLSSTRLSHCHRLFDLLI